MSWQKLLFQAVVSLGLMSLLVNLEAGFQFFIAWLILENVSKLLLSWVTPSL